MENTKLYTILLQNNILGYFRYVDDIVIVYNDSNTGVDKLLDYFNNEIPTMTFSIEKVLDNSINFLDITIRKSIENVSFSIYRKPTTTDTIIPNDSCHPQEHKHAAIHYMLNRMNSYQLNKSSKEQEYNTIKQIMYNNKCEPSTLNINITKHTEKQEKNDTQKWAKFMHIGKETKFITKLFKNSPVKISFTTNNTIGRILSHRPTHTKTRNQLHKSGVYRLTCSDCDLKYVGQTGRFFSIRFQERYRDFKYNNNKSKFAMHLLENHHSTGHTDNIIEVLYITKRGRTMDTIEKYYIYKETKNVTKSMIKTQ